MKSVRLTCHNLLLINAKLNHKQTENLADSIHDYLGILQQDPSPRGCRKKTDAGEGESIRKVSVRTEMLDDKTRISFPGRGENLRVQLILPL